MKYSYKIKMVDSNSNVSGSHMKIPESGSNAIGVHLRTDETGSKPTMWYLNSEAKKKGNHSI